MSTNESEAHTEEVAILASALEGVAGILVSKTTAALAEKKEAERVFTETTGKATRQLAETHKLLELVRDRLRAIDEEVLRAMSHLAASPGRKPVFAHDKLDQVRSMIADLKRVTVEEGLVLESKP